MLDAFTGGFWNRGIPEQGGGGGGQGGCQFSKRKMKKFKKHLKQLFGEN